MGSESTTRSYVQCDYTARSTLILFVLSICSGSERSPANNNNKRINKSQQSVYSRCARRRLRLPIISRLKADRRISRILRPSPGSRTCALIYQTYSIRGSTVNDDTDTVTRTHICIRTCARVSRKKNRHCTTPSARLTRPLLCRVGLSICNYITVFTTYGAQYDVVLSCARPKRMTGKTKRHFAAGRTRCLVRSLFWPAKNRRRQTKARNP